MYRSQMRRIACAASMKLTLRSIARFWAASDSDIAMQLGMRSLEARIEDAQQLATEISKKA
jgi:hypothetical protein